MAPDAQTPDARMQPHRRVRLAALGGEAELHVRVALLRPVNRRRPSSIRSISASWDCWIQTSTVCRTMQCKPFPNCAMLMPWRGTRPPFCFL